MVSTFEGAYLNGKPEGLGTAKFVGGHSYTGVFRDGVMDGEGTYVWADGAKFTGTFIVNKMTGRGRYEWPDGSSYEGDVIDGMREGQGVFVCGGTRYRYEGDWRQGKRHGQGKMVYGPMESSFFDGQWRNDMKHGYGVMRYLTGNIYEGWWFNNVKHGDHGIMHWKNSKERYEGSWRNGKQHGLGQHIWFQDRTDGSHFYVRNRYDGHWENGKRHGKGSFYYASGAIYSGEWRDNMKDGPGVFQFEDGSVYDGLFESDRMLGSMPPPPPSLEVPFVINVSDLVQDPRPDANERLLKHISTIVTRHIILLRRTYQFYAMLGAFVDPPGQHPDHVCCLPRLLWWKLLSDCRVPTKTLTLAGIDRILALPSRDVQMHAAIYQHPHAPLERVLLRDMVEGLARVAIVRFEKTDLKPHERFSKLLMEHIEPAFAARSLHESPSSVTDLATATNATDPPSLPPSQPPSRPTTASTARPTAGDKREPEPARVPTPVPVIKMLAAMKEAEATREKERADKPAPLSATGSTNRNNASTRSIGSTKKMTSSSDVRTSLRRKASSKDVSSKKKKGDKEPQTPPVPPPTAAAEKAMADALTAREDAEADAAEEAAARARAEKFAAVGDFRAEMLKSESVALTQAYMMELLLVYGQRASRPRMPLPDSADDVTMTCRDLIFLLEDGGIVDENFTASALLSIMNEGENGIFTEDGYDMEQEIVFYQFLVGLAGAAACIYHGTNVSFGEKLARVYRPLVERCSYRVAR